MGPNANTTYTPDRDSLFAVAKLSADGSNWVTFKTRFIYAMAGRDIEGHFDGSEPFPTPPTFSTMEQNKWTPKDEAKHESHLKSIRTWKRNERTLPVHNWSRPPPTHCSLESNMLAMSLTCGPLL